MNFMEKLTNAIRKNKSLLCVGLDPDPELMPDKVSVFEFNRAIIDATADLVCAYKPNLAFYEALGNEGLEALKRTVDYIPADIPVIGDAKRGDIGNTGERYATALFDDLKFDAVTISPYMGRDSVEPFLTRPGKGVFLLALTSNPGSADFQRVRVAGRPLYEHVVKLSGTWASGIGYVVGATHPGELKRVRALAPRAPLLIPGVGSQGGDLEAAVRAGVTAFGDLAVINASRSILYASSGRDFARSARTEAKRMQDAMERVRAAL